MSSYDWFSIALTRKERFDLHNTGSDRVDPNAVLRLLLSKSASKGSDGTLGRCIVEKTWVAHIRCDRTAVYDAVATPHVLQSVFRHSEHGDNVGLESLLRDIEVDLGDVLAHFLHSSCSRTST